MANATMEQANKGQIGQPAACMMPSKGVSPLDDEGDYGLPLGLNEPPVPDP